MMDPDLHKIQWLNIDGHSNTLEKYSQTSFRQLHKIAVKTQDREAIESDASGASTLI
jgi:hypothetical protein